MKKIILLFALCFSVAFLKAQGNLQFNQVIVYNIPASGTQAFTVPVGKVWKIESIGVGGGSSTGVYLRDAASNLATYFMGALSDNNAKLPFWLPSSFVGSFQSGGTNPYRTLISIIEFNVVP